jgi:hypothetical protein
MTTKSPADNIPLANEFPHPPPPEPGSHPINRFFDHFLVVLFCLVIVVPLIGTGRKWDEKMAALEKRKLEAFPEAPRWEGWRKFGRTYRETTNWPEHYFKYFKDNFGFRSTLIYYFQDFRFRNGLLTHNDKVLLGKDHWLFYSQRPHMGFLRERGFTSLSENQLESWRVYIENRTAFLKTWGIPYLLVICPEKQSIYPEQMPKDMEAWVDGPGTYAPGATDQFLAYLKEHHSQAHVLDLRPVLRDYKKKHPDQQLYFTADTHWNDMGAYVGYTAIMAEVQKLLPQYKFEVQKLVDFRKVPYKRVCDLVPMLGLQNQMEEPITIFGRVPPYYLRDEVDWKWGGVREPGDPFARPATPEEASKPRLLMPRDSFTNSLFQMIGPHFDRPCFWFQDNLDLDMLAKVRPNIVIHEIIELKLRVNQPGDPPQITDPKLWPKPPTKAPATSTAPAASQANLEKP